VAEASVVHPKVKVYEFIQQNSECNVPKLRQFLNNDPVLQKIQGITIPIYETSDSFCWGVE